MADHHRNLVGLDTLQSIERRWCGKNYLWRKRRFGVVLIATSCAILSIIGSRKASTSTLDCGKDRHPVLETQENHSLLPVKSKEQLPYPVDIKELGNEVYLNRMCGNWQKGYLSLQNNMVNLQRKSGMGKFLIFSSCDGTVGCGGLGDHLCGVISAFLMAVHFQRAFLVDWPNLENLNLLIPSAIDWRIRDDLKLEKDAFGSRKLCNLTRMNNHSVVLDFMNFGSPMEYSQVFSCLQRVEHVRVVWIHINRGFSHWAINDDSDYGERLRDMGFRAPFAAGCILRFLFRPHAKLEEKAAPFVLQMRNNSAVSVCIHARHGWNDAEFNRTALDLEEYVAQSKPLFDCAQTLSSYWGGDDSEPVWFFMTALVVLKRIVWGAFGDKVLTTTFENFHVELSSNKSAALEAALTDWYIFSKCNFFVLHDSGLSKSAAAYALRPLSLFVFDRVDSSGQCDPEAPTTTENFGSTWSGI